MIELIKGFKKTTIKQDPIATYNVLMGQLDSNFRKLEKDINSISSNYIDLDFSFTTNESRAFSHGLGKIPTGWEIIDNYCPTTAFGILVRTAWTSTSITLELRSSVAGTVNYKVRVFI